MRSRPTILHLDLDAFFAAVEQRDKPSLRGKPVIVGGIGQRGVVATASYEARVFGVHSAMPAHEARRRCPHAAFLGGRFGAYRQASGLVMAALRELSPLVEPLSLDEAFVDLETGERTWDEASLLAAAEALRATIAERTGGLTASVGIGTSKFIAKVASELAKPDGVRLIPAGTEIETIAGLPARAIPGVGPVTMERLARFGVKTVGDVQRLSVAELVRELGRSAGEGLHALAFARDDRAVEPERETKSISVEDTFEHDLTDPAELARIVERDAGAVAERLQHAKLFARTITLKARYPDFTTLTRSRTLDGATDAAPTIALVARSLLDGVDARRGVRLLGVGVAGLTEVAQEALFEPSLVGSSAPPVELVEAPPPATTTPAATTSDIAQTSDAAPTPDVAPTPDEPPSSRRTPGSPDEPDPGDRPGQRAVVAYRPGADVVHDEHGPGWVWGAGLGRVTVRFETAQTGPGPVRTFSLDDPALRPAES